MTRAECQDFVEATAPDGVDRQWIVEGVESLFAQGIQIQKGHKIDFEWFRANKKTLWAVGMFDLKALQRRSQS
jgi:hypothetical protein